jgi:hypothetical protein
VILVDLPSRGRFGWQATIGTTIKTMMGIDQSSRKRYASARNDRDDDEDNDRLPNPVSQRIAHPRRVRKR